MSALWKHHWLRWLAGIAFCGALLAGCCASAKLRWKAPLEGEEVWGIVMLQVATCGINPDEHVDFYLDVIDQAHLLGSAQALQNGLLELPWYTAETHNGAHTLYAVLRNGEAALSTVARATSIHNRSREEAIPQGGIKMTPALDQHPPRLEPAFRDIFEEPVPLGAPIDTSGAEDSPFISPDGNTLFFWFTPLANAPLQEQATDRVTGIYWSHKLDDTWSEPQRIFLSYFGEVTLDGAQTAHGDELWFASVREGNYREIDFYIARLDAGRWVDWVNAGQLLNVEYWMGEMHVSADGKEIYFDSTRAGGKGAKDIWVTGLVDGEWQEPENLQVINSERTDGWPFLSEDGNEMWFTRGDPGAPEIWRALRQDGVWQPPQMVLSSFAGEPTLDEEGNLYFAHHFWDTPTDSMIEADIYVCYRRGQ
jgi:hypothetical protein